MAEGHNCTKNLLKGEDHIFLKVINIKAYQSIGHENQIKKYESALFTI